MSKNYFKCFSELNLREVCIQCRCNLHFFACHFAQCFAEKIRAMTSHYLARTVEFQSAESHFQPERHLVTRTGARHTYTFCAPRFARTLRVLASVPGLLPPTRAHAQRFQLCVGVFTEGEGLGDFIT